jgi:hypothetical protein
VWLQGGTYDGYYYDYGYGQYTGYDYNAANYGQVCFMCPAEGFHASTKHFLLCLVAGLDGYTICINWAQPVFMCCKVLDFLLYSMFYDSIEA